jgi:transcriptional regulator with XRE-family HTH domain
MPCPTRPPRPCRNCDADVRTHRYSACVRRHELAARRRAAGLSQERLAQRLHVDRTTVGRWEQGTSTPQPWHRRPLAEALKVTLDMLDGLLATGSEPPAEWWQDGDMDRRTFLAGFGGSLTAALLQLEDAVLTTPRDEQRQSVLRLLAHAHHAAGESAFDRLELQAAVDQFHQAHEIGVELGDSDTIAGAQIQLGDVARRRRQYGRALRVLDAAERQAATASVLTQVRGHQARARAFAELSDRARFERAIGRADELVATIPVEHQRAPAHSAQGLRLERGQGLTLLGRPAAALAIYDEISPSTFGTDREQGSFLIIHAQALAHAGHRREGVSVAVRGLELARGYGSARHVSRVQRMYDRLARTWPRSEPALVDLRDALAA